MTIYCKLWKSSKFKKTLIKLLPFTKDYTSITKKPPQLPRIPQDASTIPSSPSFLHVLSPSYFYFQLSSLETKAEPNTLSSLESQEATYSPRACNYTALCVSIPAPLSLLWISPGRIFGGLARGHSAKIDLAGPVRKRGECGVRSAQWKQRDGLSSSALSLLRICRLANRLHPRWKLGFSRLFLKSDGAVSRLLAVKWSWDFFFLETGGGGRSRKGIEEVGWFIKG